MIAAIRRALRIMTPEEVSSRDLLHAQLSRLEAKKAQEYSTAMVGYYDVHIARLNAEKAEKQGA